MRKYIIRISFYFFLFLIILVFLELSSFLLVQSIKKNPLIMKSMHFYNSKKIINELENYIDLVPYVSGEKFINLIDESISETLFYETYKKFNVNNSENILISGDSWAVIANIPEIRNKLTSLANKRNFGLINAGKSSYSISPITVQLDILLKKFKLKPSMLIVIIDQSDLGDEIHRYQSLDLKSLKMQETKVHNEFKKQFFTTLESNNLNSLKILIMFEDFYQSRLVQFDNDNYKTIKYIFKRLFYLITKTQALLAPLKYGLNDYERNLINLRFEKYINYVFDNNINKIVFVTHPHKNHIGNKNKYKENISLIIDEIIKKSKHSEKIMHINFIKDFKEIYKEIPLANIFRKNDPQSHLTDEIYMNIYFPYIFDKCCN